MLVINIDDQHKNAFENLMPANLFARIGHEGFFSLGVVEETEHTAAGTLVFSVEEGSNGTEDLVAAVIQWFYVATPFRCRGFAEALLRELFRVLEEAGVAHILCDIPLPEEYNGLCAYLESWGFDVWLNDVYETSLPLCDFLRHPLLSDPAQINGVLSLAETPAYYVRSHLQKLQESFSLSEDPNAYEPQISCTFLTHGGIEGSLLVRRDADSFEVLSLHAPTPAAALNLIRYAVHAAARQCPPDIPIHLVCRRITSAAILDKLFPHLQPLLVRRAYYSVFQPEDDSAEQKDG